MLQRNIYTMIRLQRDRIMVWAGNFGRKLCLITKRSKLRYNGST